MMRKCSPRWARRCSKTWVMRSPRSPAAMMPSIFSDRTPSRFDIVITDQTMPDLPGVELAEAMLVLKPGVPIILCTGYSHLVDAEAARAKGIKAFVMKPLTKSEIALTIRDVQGE